MPHSVRVRFAPSPTGNVHIGNIRVAIFNWLFARHEHGAFLLRVEDTDLERSTPEAKKILFDTLEWLQIDYDEPPVYQSERIDEHIRAADTIQQRELAIRFDKGGKGDTPPLIFTIPYDLNGVPFIRETGQKRIALFPDDSVTISRLGVDYRTASKKGKPVDQNGVLGGFKDLTILGENGDAIFRIDDALNRINAGETIVVDHAFTLAFTGREVFYDDWVKGRLSKPLDSVKNIVIMRGDGTPVFHLANVVDDIAMRVTHILRGDDHIENTYRHLFLYWALDAELPKYGHFPMLVNQQGKKLSKRDGDAEVQDFRHKGYLPEALFNFLTLMGWSPGDGREVMTRAEMIDAFTLDRVKSTPAQMNYDKLAWMNGQYLAHYSAGDILTLLTPYLDAAGIDLSAYDPQWITDLITIMTPRIRTLPEFVDATRYFFLDDVIDPDTSMKSVRKALKKDSVPAVLDALSRAFEELGNIKAGGEKTMTELAPALHAKCESVANTLGVSIGDVAQPLRIALTGGAVSPPIGETLALVGTAMTRRRIQHLRDTLNLSAQ